MADTLDLIAYRVANTPDYRLVRAPLDRDWMDATGEQFAYRCLPLNIANQHGWAVLNTVSFRAMWTGKQKNTSVKVELLDEEVAAAGAVAPAFGHFGSGVLTFHLPWLFRTPPGWNLHAHGPANHVKDAIVPLEGIVETDWAISPFTFNWRFNAINTWTTFEKDEPICMLTPVQRGALERFVPREVDIDDEPELKAAYIEWRESRDYFIKDLSIPGSEARVSKWQRHYFRGVQPDGKAAPQHQTKLDLKEFKMLPPESRRPDPEPDGETQSPDSHSMLRIPTELFPELDQIRERLKLAEEPVFIPSVPRPDSVPDHGPDDVALQVAEQGGKAVYGWMIWHWPRMMAEATFHAVWKAPDGSLKDVSANHQGAEKILFIPDPSITNDGNRLNAVRIALWDHQLMHDFIRTSDEFIAEVAAQCGPGFVGEVEMEGKLLELHDRRVLLLQKLQSFPRGKGA